MYKKIARLLWASTLMGIVITTYANTTNTPIKITYNSEPLNLNHEIKYISNRIVLPIRDISEQFGYNVNWDPSTNKIDISNTLHTITLYINQSKALVDNKTVPLDVPAKSLNCTTFVPLRFIAEAFNIKTNWISKTHTVELISQDDEIITANGFWVDKTTKKLMQTKDGNSIIIGDVTYDGNERVVVDISTTSQGSQLVRTTEVFVGFAAGSRRNYFYIKNGNLIKNVSNSCYLPVIDDITYTDNIVTLCDDTQLFVYDDTSGTLINTYHLTKLMGEGIYHLEAAGDDYAVVRSNKILKILQFSTGKSQEIYKLIPSAADQAYATLLIDDNPLAGWDNIQFVSKSGNQLKFSYLNASDHTTSYLLYTLE